ncbi:hypothetical protein BwiPL1_54350 (plasmid) [Bacillus wiedmannii]|nr:hypothetical protein BwiPL1_54350 [Bacillus wiedmannii]
MIQISVSGIVPPLKQDKQNGCWATVATIMLSWKDQKSYNISDVLNQAGVNQSGVEYTKIYDADTGLSTKDFPDLIQNLKLSDEPLQDYTFNGFKNLLESYGPIWVIIAPNPNIPVSLHAVVVTGINGDDSSWLFTIIDPSDGTEKQVDSNTLNRKIDAVSPDLTIQVVHFP